MATLDNRFLQRLSGALRKSAAKQLSSEESNDYQKQQEQKEATQLNDILADNNSLRLTSANAAQFLAYVSAKEQSGGVPESVAPVLRSALSDHPGMRDAKTQMGVTLPQMVNMLRRSAELIVARAAAGMNTTPVPTPTTNTVQQPTTFTNNVPSRNR